MDDLHRLRYNLLSYILVLTTPSYIFKNVTLFSILCSNLDDVTISLLNEFSLR